MCQLEYKGHVYEKKAFCCKYITLWLTTHKDTCKQASAYGLKAIGKIQVKIFSLSSHKLMCSLVCNNTHQYTHMPKLTHAYPAATMVRKRKNLFEKLKYPIVTLAEHSVSNIYKLI